MATNELDLHNNKVAKLIEYGVAGSVREVEFLYDNYRYEGSDMAIYIFSNKDIFIRAVPKVINCFVLLMSKKFGCDFYS